MKAKLLDLRVATLGAGTVIRRALPQRELRRIGAWCFLDHLGPQGPDQGGLDVGPHPHVGLQTFTWMLQGELLHRDSLGYEQVIRPKQVNLMTAGHGIAHSENTVSDHEVLQTAQFWIALPRAQKDIPPQFAHYPNLPERVDPSGVQYVVLMGQFMGLESPVPSYSPLMAVDVKTGQAQQLEWALNPDFEYGVLVLKGQAQIAGQIVAENQLWYGSVGQSALAIQLEAGSHLIVLGGAPYTDEIAIWWNFVCHSQQDLEQAYQDWQGDHARFGVVAGYEGPPMAAPALPDKVRFS